MDKNFGQSFLISLGVHLALFLVLFWVLGTFLVARTPAFMELTLIGISSRGDGPGAQQTLRGETSVSPEAADPGKGDTFSSPKVKSDLKQQAAPKAGDLAVKRPTPSTAQTSKSDQSAYLQALHQSAPIGISPKRAVPDSIKTTAGLGYGGVTGTPNGRVDIEGELAARGIQRKVVPAYPDWAKKQGVEGTIQYRVTVLPNGYLRDDVQLEQTSGWRELDRQAYEALLQWEFDPLPSAMPQVNQSGLVTFNFSFKNQP